MPPKKRQGKYHVMVMERQKNKRFIKTQDYWTDKMPQSRNTKNKRIVISMAS